MHIEYPSRISISDLVKRLKGRTSRRLQDEYPDLKKRYWGRHFQAIGYGAQSTGNITDEMVQEYLEHHRDPSNADTGNIILEQVQGDFQSRGSLWSFSPQSLSQLIQLI